GCSRGSWLTGSRRPGAGGSANAGRVDPAGSAGGTGPTGANPTGDGGAGGGTNSGAAGSGGSGSNRLAIPGAAPGPGSRAGSASRLSRSLTTHHPQVRLPARVRQGQGLRLGPAVRAGERVDVGKQPPGPRAELRPEEAGHVERTLPRGATVGA